MTLALEEAEQVSGGYDAAQAVGAGMLFLASVGIAAVAMPAAFAAVGGAAGAISGWALYELV